MDATLLLYLQIVNVRLPDDRGRAKGFGYAEFEDRQSLIDALSLHDEVSLQQVFNI